MNPTWTCTTCAACPATQPTGACTTPAAACRATATCSYGTTSCDCERTAGGGAGGAGGAGAAGTWSCGSCPAIQPAPAPAAATTCTTAGLACTYDATICTCRPGAMGAGDTFECFTPPTCPATEPTAGDTCTAGSAPAAGCPYGTSTCRCARAGGRRGGAAPADAGAEAAAAGDTWTCN